MMATLLAWGLLLLSSSCALGQQSVTSAYVRPSPVPLLPLNHERLVRTAGSPHDPEQVQLALAGPGAMAISWVTNPQVNDVVHTGFHRYIDRGSLDGKAAGEAW